MAEGTPIEVQYPVSLDEVGLALGMQRLPGESGGDYKQRLKLHARVPPGVTQDDYLLSLNRNVGEFDKVVFKIDLVRDAQGEPLVSDPYIEIDSTFIRIYSDYTNSDLALELNTWERSEAYFLKDVYANISTISWLTIRPAIIGYEYLKSRNLLYGNSERAIEKELLVKGTMNKLEKGLIRDAIFPLPRQFLNEVASVDAISDRGDYYFDRTNGVLFTEDLVTGGITYTYREFPFEIKWQSVSAVPYNDKSIDFLRKDNLIDDATGLEKRLSLNPYGASIANNILSQHSLQWGK